MSGLVAWGDFGLAVVVVAVVASVVVSTGSFSKAVKSEAVASVSGDLSLFADDMIVRSVMGERGEGCGYRVAKMVGKEKGSLSDLSRRAKG